MKRTRKSEVEPLCGAAGECFKHTLISLMMSFLAPSHVDFLSVCAERVSSCFCGIISFLSNCVAAV